MIELQITHISDTSITAKCNQDTLFSGLYAHWQWLQQRCGYKIEKIYSLINSKMVIVQLVK